MTTIAASVALRAMAGDSSVHVESADEMSALVFGSTKLLRLRGAIVGCAGDNEEISRFMRWYGTTARRPRLGPDFEALVLTRDKLLHFAGGSDPDVVRDGYMAIGAGASVALGALAAMEMLGLPADPRIAVQAAARHDKHTKEPIDFLRWAPERKGR